MAELKNVLTGEERGPFVPIYKTEIKGGADHCFAGKFMFDDSNEATVIVKKDYNTVVIRTTEGDAKCKMKKITPKGKDAFLIGRVGQWSLTLMYSKFYEEKPERNAMYSVSVRLLDADQMAEAAEKELEYAAKEAEFEASRQIDLGEIDLDDDDDLDI